jgi:hypothetical protein
MPVMKLALRPVLFVLVPLPPANRPFSRSAITHGPEPMHWPGTTKPNQHNVPK